MTAKEKINILEILIKQLKTQHDKCLVALEQAENDWIKLNSCDGDKSQVTKNPILSACDGRVHTEIAIKIVNEMERLLND